MGPSPHHRVSRRTTLGLLAGSLASAVWAQGQTVAEKVEHLAIGNYGMQSLTLEDAIREVAAIGFGGFELCAIPQWDSTPTRMDNNRRKAVRSLLEAASLRLVAVMEDLPPQADEGKHAQGQDRLKAAIELGRDLSPAKPALVQTVLGGGQWDEVKNMFRDRVGDWAQLAERLDATVCIKPHRFGAMSTPAQAAWIIEQLNNTARIRIVYDYSHYAFRDLSIADTIQQGRQLIAYVAMKDAVQSGDKVSFALPGEKKTIDHAAIAHTLAASGYRGDFCCEVSGQVSSKPGYEPIAAARVCFENMKAVPHA
ncbi:MAG: sugar phosphate isomerase/epimerase [Planctomycetaceae bacterium]